MNSTVTAKPVTIAEVMRLPNHLEARSLAGALEESRKYMRENYNYTGPLGYSKRFMEGTRLVYLFYSSDKEAHYKVYVIF